MYLCIYCKTRPAASACDTCVGVSFDAPGETPAIDDVAPGSPPDPDPAPGRSLPAVRTTARAWLADDLLRDRIAREWSARLLAKRGAA